MSSVVDLKQFYLYPACYNVLNVLSFNLQRLTSLLYCFFFPFTSNDCSLTVYVKLISKAGHGNRDKQFEKYKYHLRLNNASTGKCNVVESSLGPQTWNIGAESRSVIVALNIIKISAVTPPDRTLLQQVALIFSFSFSYVPSSLCERYKWRATMLVHDLVGWHVPAFYVIFCELCYRFYAISMYS